jgi:NAD(P)H-nitrite reductase large subunit
VAEREQKDIIEKGATLQRDGETFAVTPRIPCGLITDFGLLRRIADAAERYGATALKITSSERIAIVGIHEADLDRLYADLGATPGFANGLCVRSINACPGNRYCRLGQQDSLGLGLRLERRFANLSLPCKVKMGVSGCPMSCGNTNVRDIGLVGSRKGYTLKIGGSAGVQPHLAVVLEEDVPPEEAEGRVERLIELIARLGRKKRLFAIVEELGIEGVRARLAGGV